ncbi:MAG: hypothetical protein ACI863_001080 [Flavobacteriales bacterium]|jgi:hypothetical protein
MKMKKNHFFTFILIFIISSSFAQPPAEGGTEFFSGDLIIVPNSTNINTTAVNTRTIETYFKVDNGTSRQVIYEEGDAAVAFSIFIESGYIHMGAFSGSGTNSIYFRKPILNDVWYHVALVLDHDTAILGFYIDGALQDSTFDAFSIPSHSNGISLGFTEGIRYPDCLTWTVSGSSEKCVNDTTSSDSSPYYFSGHLWGFRVWNTARTASEINSSKNILITDTSTSPGNDLLLFLDVDFDFVTYLDSNDIYQTTDFVLEVNESDIVDTSTKIYLNENVLQIETLPSNTVNRVRVYSISGQLILDKKHNEGIKITAFSKGVYIVKLNFENNDKVLNKKIIIH